jgi:hypothetical protein
VNFLEFGGFFGFLGTLVGFLDFFWVLQEKVAEFGHPSRTRTIGILENFWGFLGILSFFEYFQDFRRIIPESYRIFGLLRMLAEYIGFSGFFFEILLLFVADRPRINPSVDFAAG